MSLFDRNHNRRPLYFTASVGLSLLLALGACSHVKNASKNMTFHHAPPGTAVQVAMAKKAEAVPTPPPPPVAAINPDMPAQDAKTETVADYYTLGNLMMQQEKYPEAIKAYESAVKLDPTFYDAWNHLAICYQDTGQNKKALDAYKKSKAIAHQQ